MKVTAFLMATNMLLSPFFVAPIASRQLPVLPLSAADVYRLLRQAGREDAIPEGRVITQGLAAMTGFALGLTKAIGGVLLYDIITANVTEADLLASGAGTTNGGVGATTELQTQEICFNSRSARNLDEAAAIANAYDKQQDAPLEDVKSNRIRGSDTRRRTRPKRRRPNRKRGALKKKNKKRLEQVSTGTGSGTILGSGSGTPTGSVTVPTGTGLATNTGTSSNTVTNNAGTSATSGSSPSSSSAPLNSETASGIGTGGGTGIESGSGTGTTSSSTTSTGKETAMNCVVIQKQKK